MLCWLDRWPTRTARSRRQSMSGAVARTCSEIGARSLRAEGGQREAGWRQGGHTGAWARARGGRCGWAFRELERVGGVLARLNDRAGGAGGVDLTLEIGQLLVVGRDGLAQPVLQADGRGRVGLSLRLHQERRALELVIKGFERGGGEVGPMAGDHRLRLGEAGFCQVEMVSELVRGTESQGAAHVLEHTL